MQLTHHGRPLHLTWCTNIHAGESWDEVSTSLDATVPRLRRHLADAGHGVPGRFGIGLRLSYAAAMTLAQPAALQAFQAQLARLDAYVFTINAFPYGQFHGVRVKEQAYQPDWRDARRYNYTVAAAGILAQLLPDGMCGSISTVPGAFGAAGAAAFGPITQQLVCAADVLAAIERSSGKRIVLALEPEPACLLETTADVLAFFSDYLFGASACAQMAVLAKTSTTGARELLRRHLGVCFDVCHAAVGFEDPVAALQRLRRAGIAVPKIQLSSALRIPAMDAGLADAVARFDDGVYLHQVTVRAGPAQPLRRYLDLPQALAAFGRGEAAGEWRIHCHVPVLQPLQDGLASTDAELRAVLASLGATDPLPHLEVETYTWDVLPPACRAGTKAASIACELGRVIEELAACAP